MLLDVCGVYGYICDEEVRRWSHEGPTRVEGAPRGVGAPPHTRGPHVAPLIDFLHLYILSYPENIQEHHETLFTLPQPSVPMRSHLGAFSGTPPEGKCITEAFYISATASPMMCE